MAKKKKSNDEIPIEEQEGEKPKEESFHDKSNRKMRPTEWAREEGLDPHLFLHWDGETMSFEEYEKLKEKAL